jgi:hypothetical protein
VTIAYPMIEEDEATGRVAAVYADVLARAPLVPSLLKSLGVCPPYLVLAWEQRDGDRVPSKGVRRHDRRVVPIARSREDRPSTCVETRDSALSMRRARTPR